MWKKAAVGAAAIMLAGSIFAHAQQPGSPGPGPAAAPHAAPDTGARHPSLQDMNAFADARIAALHAGLVLNADQEKNWPAFEQALRELSKMRIARIEARQKAMTEQPSESQRPLNPIERLQKRAEAMSVRGAALKRLADAAAPLYQSLDDAQKHRFMVLARALRPHGQHRAMWHGRFGDNGMAAPGGMGRFHMGPHRFGDQDMREPHHMGRDDDDGDYRGPL